jgi:uncharacterized membrane protein YgaE (UPF0421/DUF939 family)
MDSRTELKNMLSEMLSLNVVSKQGLKQWYESAQKAERQAMEAEIDLPHLVWHYLSDADIRFKEPEYGQEQIEAVQSFIEVLASGSTNA